MEWAPIGEGITDLTHSLASLSVQILDGLLHSDWSDQVCGMPVFLSATEEALNTRYSLGEEAKRDRNSDHSITIIIK